MSLFLLLLMGLWWALEKRWYDWAMVRAGLPLCRGIGAFTVLPLAWHPFTVTPPRWWKHVWSRRLAASARTGLGCSGDLGAEVQVVGQSTPAATNGRNTYGAASCASATYRVVESGLQRTAVRAPWLLVDMPVLWRLAKGLLLWTYMLGILPGRSGTFTSFTRYGPCAFPMPVAGTVLCRRDWRGFRYALLGVFVVLHFVLVWRYTSFHWAA